MLQALAICFEETKNVFENFHFFDDEKNIFWKSENFQKSKIPKYPIEILIANFEEKIDFQKIYS